MANNEQELREKIITKAWSDPYFKERLIADPKGAIEEAFGVIIPNEVNIKILEETEDTYYLVLPQKPSDLLQNSVQGPMWV
ncbi:NHLP leader peptide family RiPP precursor [Paenibacillus nanensis]|uniref:NHLP leader peptide family RiPP precursor n=1 Tax=Paenibacillus nanensis TaxID=393251 RepID=UPI001F0CBFDD|nr:NHLP leader peptide family RiPP precursor [Paenibacillus nanensis]